MSNLFNLDDFKANTKKGHKTFFGTNLIIHCHHYNSRLQRTIENCKLIDGKAVFKKAVASGFIELLENIVKEKKDATKEEIAAEAFSMLGFGKLDLSQLKDGKLYSSHSHYVEGWKCGSLKKSGCVCSFTEGYLGAAIKFISGDDVLVEEVSCMNEGQESCEFKFSPSKDLEIKAPIKKKRIALEVKNQEEDSSNIDKEVIVEAVMGLPLEGNNEGLIPAFNVYLGLMPKDVYNLMCFNFVKEMDQKGMKDLAVSLLIEDAENCALNTFGGILQSDEWAGLIQPMVKEERDKIFGLVAVANALGWGRISIHSHKDRDSLRLSSSNGYEADGYLELYEEDNYNKCFMLTGICAGLMELIYEKGELEDRSGRYIGKEDKCLCKKDELCTFESKHAA